MKCEFRLCTVTWFCTVAWHLAGTLSQVQAFDEIRYSTQVAPVLQKYCVGCHNRVEAAHGLSLQGADDILKGDETGAVLNAEHPEGSRLLTVLTAEGDDHMPPLDQPQLSAEELAMVHAWISSGGQFDSRMAVLPALPKVMVTAKQVRNPVLSIAVASDGRVFSGRFRSVEVAASTGADSAWSVPIADGKVNSIALSKDEAQILLATGVSGLSGRAVVVDVATAAITREFSGHRDMVYAAVWSPDEQIVATAGYDRRILLHNSRTGEVLQELTGHNGAIFDLAFSPDGSLLASASADATIKIWHVSTGERFDTLSQPQSEQYSVVLSSDGGFVYAAGADSRIRKWQLVSLSEPRINPLVLSRFAHEGVITRMELSADSRYLATASEGGSVKVWDAVLLTELAAWDLPNDRVSSMAFGVDGKTLLVESMAGERKQLMLPALPASGEVVSEVVSIAMAKATTPLTETIDVEPNNDAETAQVVAFPARVTGTISEDSEQPAKVSEVTAVNQTADVDAFRFDAKRGQTVLIEVKAARNKSPLDSLVDVVTLDGKPVLQAQLQAVRDSYFTFRGKDSDTSDDFRVFNWQEMELNEYLYADGEVVKLWLYPRGPDSGFKVYPGFGPREAWFNTTPASHALQAPAFIVTPHAPNAVLRDTGLPVFPIMAENDDDSMRQWGKDSRLMFVPPNDGTYVVRIRDARGFQGADFKYELLIRQPQPDFSVVTGGGDLTIHPLTGREISFTATRQDGYSGPIEIIAENLPTGFSLSDPVLIQDEQRQAFATLIAAADATTPTAEAVSQVKFKARAMIGDREVVHEIGGLKGLKLAEKPKVLVKILTSEQHAAGQFEHTPELTVWAGETTRAVLKVERNDHDGLVEFGKEDSGRNLPHGVFVDNIGLNGLMLLQGQSEREFFITTAKWVPEVSRPFYLKSSVDGITSLPVMIHVRHRQSPDVQTVSRPR